MKVRGDIAALSSICYRNQQNFCHTPDATYHLTQVIRSEPGGTRVKHAAQSRLPAAVLVQA
jgi:hypothetical protein